MIDRARSSWRRLGTWAAVAALIGGAVVAFIAIHRATRSPPLTTVPDTSGAAAARGHVPTMRLKTVDGRRLTVPAASGGAVAFVDASGCAACVSPAAALARLTRARAGVVLVDLNWRDRRRQLERFLRAAGSPSYPVVLDTSTNEIASAFAITTEGTVVVYRPGGRIVATLAEPSDRALAQALRRAGV
jgi:hypothetical protein